MARTPKRTALQHIKQAIREAGTAETGVVMLKLEDILHAEMMDRQPSYIRSTPNTRMYKIADRLERLDIFTYNDVARLIAEVLAEREKEVPARREGLRRALGL